MKPKRPTLKTVAQQAQVSLPTVSQVLRGVGRISDDTRKRVLAAADAVGYVQDHRAASVRTGRTNEVAIIVHDISNHFNAEVIGSVSTLLEAEGYFLSIMDAKGDPKRLEKLVRIVLAKTCAGLLWVPSDRVDPSLVELIVKQAIPTVTFLRKLSKASFSFLGIANAEATRTATNYLKSIGHVHIAFAGGFGENQTRQARIAGYTSAVNTPLVFNAEDTRHGGFDFAQELLVKRPEVTAVICNGDEFAIGLCLGLQRLNKQPGADISVIGFDDIDEAELITPSLTTLSISPVNFGARLAQLLLDEFNSSESNRKDHFVHAELIIRESTSALL